MRNINKDYSTINSYKKSTYMNTKIKHYLALLVFTVLSIPIFAQVDVAQKPYYDYNRDWTFGIHGGVSWQQSDINDRFGGGLGLTLGKRFYGEPNSFWAVDWRGRLTYSNSFGQGSLLDTNATSISDLNNFLVATNGDGVSKYTDGFLENYRTDMVDIDLEAVLTANRLRERTGVILQLFGGLGFDFYNSKIDQLDGNGNVYDYTTIDYTQKDRQIRRDAGDMRGEFFRGGDYESGEGTKLTFMPSWGLGIGYQLRPWFSFGYEHRFAYPFTDELDTKVELNAGEDWTNDKHHLSYLYARFHFGAKGDCNPPLIRILSPTANPLSTQAPSINVEAEIENLSSRREITVTVNGLPNYSFDYNTSSDKFNLPVLLEQGENVIRIEADNNCDEEFAIIKVVYNPNIVAGTPPSVVFTNPSTNRYTTTDQTYNVNAQLERVKSKTDVTFSLNGQNTRNFNYNTRTGIVSANIDLREGQNTVKVTGRNKYGEDSETVYVIFNRPVVAEPVPTVNITRPSNDPYTTSDSRYRVEARIQNVSSKQDVSFRVNGVDRDFSYSNGRLTANINLVEGNNRVEISGYNTAGSDQDETTIVYKRNVIDPPTINPPVVDITDPRSAQTTVTTSTEDIRATVRNVTSKNNITFTVNGKRVYNFSYNSSTDVFKAEVNLIEGANTIRIEGKNSAGTDDDSRTIVYKKETPVVSPPIVTILDPRLVQTTVNVNTDNIRATVRNVDSKNDITFTVNGKRIYNFSYNSGTEAFKADVTLIQGTNTIRIEGRNSAGTDDDSRTIVYKTLAPVTRPPVVKVTSPSANPHNTTTDRQSIKATVNHAEKSQITFTVNGQRVTNFTFNNTTDVFTANVALRTGSNNFEIKAVNSAGNDSDGGTIVYKKPVTAQPPTVDITSPAPNALVYGTTQQIVADVANVSNKNQITFTVNGSRSTDFTYNASTDKFEGTAKNLVSGSNTVKIVATNSAGNDNDQVTFLVRIASTPPTVTIQRPSSNPLNTSSERSSIIAKVTGVSNKNELDVLLNGRSVPFRYNSGNGTVRADVTLREGSNSYTVKATTAGGADQKGGTIVYTKTVPGPRITVTSPTRNPHTTTNKRQTITAKITNLTSKNQVKFTMNGSEVNSFRFEPRSGAFSFTTDLKEGSNRFMIDAENAGGDDSYKGEIIYKITPTVQPPQVIISTPTNNAMVSVDNAAVKATIKNVTTKSDVTYTVNGSNVSSFNFNTRTGAFLANAKLRSGTNTIVIKGKNSAGDDTETVKVIYRMGAGQKPVITVTNLNASPYTTTDGKVGIEGKILYINGKSDASVKVNGSTTGNWTYDAMSDEYLIDHTWRVGTNNVVITATNSAGTTTRTQVIVFRQVSAPQVQFTSPTSNNGNTSVIRSVADVRATIQNTDKRGITFTVNGKRVPYSFSGTSFSSKVNLAQGKNNIKIVAKNDGGTDTESITIDYAKPVLAPTVRFTKPSGSVTVKSSSYSVRANVKNINAKKDITIMLNNRPVNSFSFNSSSGALGFNVTLKEGNNDVRIVVRNSAGFDNKTVTIRYQKPSVDRPNDGNNDLGSRGVKVTKPKVTKPKVTKPKPRVVQDTKPKPKVTKPAPKKPTVRKPAAKKPVNKTTVKPTQKKPTVKKPAAKKPAPKKPTENNRTKKDGNN